MDLDKFIEPKITRIPESGCWIWLSSLSKTGYAIGRPEEKHVRIHRWLYQKLHGSVGDLTLDHLCKNRCCINPNHLEPVTAGENSLRGNGPTAINARMKACKNGHPFDRLVYYSNGKTKRICSICRNERDKRGKRKRRAKAHYVAGAPRQEDQP